MQEDLDAVRDTDHPVDGFGRALDHVADHPASFQAMARALIDPTRHQTRHDSSAGFEIHRKRLADRRASGATDLDVLAVAVMAFTAGWALEEDRWLRTARLTEADRERARDQVVSLIRGLVEDA